MSAIAGWEAGRTYAPGSIVKPNSTPPPATVDPQNPNFEAGDLSGWTPSAGRFAAINFNPYSGTYCARMSGNGSAGMTNDAQALVTPGLSITATAEVKLTNSGTDDQAGQINIVWMDASGSVISKSSSTLVTGSGGHWKLATVVGRAPSGAVHASIEIGGNNGSHGGTVEFDDVHWSYAYNGPPKGLVYKATQAAPGKSGASEPVWPGQVGLTVQDNDVTWEGVIATRIVWQAVPLYESGATEPNWPNADGATVHDGTIDWIASTSRITDPKCPQSKVVQITHGKVYAANDDIINFSATVNPLDWSSKDDAGYLPFGLQTFGSNPVAAMGLYRGNLIAFNAEGFQMWQVDEDPANNALLDSLPIACIRNDALSPVANDLLFLSSRGVRSVGVAATTGSVQTGDVGDAIDALVGPALRAAELAGIVPVSTFLPALGQYWLAIPRSAFGVTDVFVGTINRPNSPIKWSRYELPFPVQYFTTLGDDLLMRSNNRIIKYDQTAVQDLVGGAPVDYQPVLQTPWLDFNAPGMTKQFTAFDLVADGSPFLSFGFNENDMSAFTDEFQIPADSLPAFMVPLQLMAVSVSIRLRWVGPARFLAMRMIVSNQGKSA